MGYWDYDFTTKAVFRSEEACRIYGFNPGELQPTHEALLQFVHPDDRERLRDANATAVFTRQSLDIEYRIVDPQEVIRWVAERGHVRFDEQGCPSRMLGVVMDVTEQKTLEEQLHQSRKLESIGALAGGVAHDFNNILTAIMLYAELAEKSCDPSCETHDFARKIRLASERASNLTRQLLAFARKQVVRPHVVDLNSLVKRAGDLLDRLLGDNIEIAYHLATDLCPARIDPTQIEQVLLNLAINARDAMPEGGRLTITTSNLAISGEHERAASGLTAGDYLLVSVSDTGTGMTRTQQMRAFEPFFTTKGVGKGTGLGLASSYGIIKQSGGDIWVESELGKGSTFHFCLPRAEEAKPREAPAPGLTTKGGTGTILLVEDEPMVRETGTLALRTRGYEVIEAKDGEDALQIAGQYEGRIDLLLTDVRMPRMAGHLLAEKLRLSRPHIRVLYVSGHADRSALRKDLKSGAAGFLQKPYTSATLASSVMDMLG
jgi:two-component system, cell cycle sensor histidine kinase and response regulator CckA